MVAARKWFYRERLPLLGVSHKGQVPGQDSAAELLCGVVLTAGFRKHSILRGDFFDSIDL